MDYYLERLAKRCQIKAAELHATAESHPNSIALRAEAKVIETLGTSFTKLVGVLDGGEANFDEFFDEPAPIPTLPHTIVQPTEQPQPVIETPAEQSQPVNAASEAPAA